MMQFTLPGVQYESFIKDFFTARWKEAANTDSRYLFLVVRGIALGYSYAFPFKSEEEKELRFLSDIALIRANYARGF